MAKPRGDSMKKVLIFSFISFFLFSQSSFAADAKVRQFHSTGEVLSVDPVYSRVTIEHAPVKDFPSGNDSEFFVESASLLKGIQKGDLVEFDLTDTKGDVKINKIVKTGVAAPKSDTLPLGRAVSDVLHGTGDVVKGVTAPIAPVHEVAKSATSVTDASGDAVSDASPEVKNKF